MLEADRRISLKNLLHETVADLWSWTSDDQNTRSASLYLYNQLNNILVFFGGRANGGYLSLNNQSGSSRALLAVGTSGGYAYVYNSSGNIVGSLFAGSAGDGTLNLMSSSNTNTINLSGQSGVVRCVSVTQTSSRKVKENIEAMDPEEAFKILELVAVTFDYKDKALGTDKRGV